MDQSPKSGAFSYIFIPCDETQEIQQHLFSEGDDAKFRKTLERHFRQILLSDDQRKEMSRHLEDKMKLTEKKNDDQEGDSAHAPPDPERQQALLDNFLESSSFEIVPVVMPTIKTNFIGVSLYIDDSGHFKDLPLNSRASKLAQRHIKGDAFLLSNHDDPALDEWKRVDCTIETYEKLYENPSGPVYERSNENQMAAVTQIREASSMVVTKDDADMAEKQKELGNNFFSSGNYDAALEAYSTAIEKTRGRRDLLPNATAVTDLHKTLLLNRSLCFYRLKKFSDAVYDARDAIALDSTNTKGYYRLAQGLIGEHDFDSASIAVADFVKHGGSQSDADGFKALISEGKAKIKGEAKKNFSRLFK